MLAPAVGGESGSRSFAPMAMTLVCLRRTCLPARVTQVHASVTCLSIRRIPASHASVTENCTCGMLAIPPAPGPAPRPGSQGHGPRGFLCGPRAGEPRPLMRAPAVGGGVRQQALCAEGDERVDLAGEPGYLHAHVTQSEFTATLRLDPSDTRVVRVLACVLQLLCVADHQQEAVVREGVALVIRA